MKSASAPAKLSKVCTAETLLAVQDVAAAAQPPVVGVRAGISPTFFSMQKAWKSLGPGWVRPIGS